MNILLTEIRSLTVDMAELPESASADASSFTRMFQQQLPVNPEQNVQAIDFNEVYSEIALAPVVREGAAPGAPATVWNEFLAQDPVRVSGDLDLLEITPVNLESMLDTAATTRPLPDASAALALGEVLPPGGKLLPDGIPPAIAGLSSPLAVDDTTVMPLQPASMAAAAVPAATAVELPQPAPPAVTAPSQPVQPAVAVDQIVKPQPVEASAEIRQAVVAPEAVAAGLIKSESNAAPAAVAPAAVALNDAEAASTRPAPVDIKQLKAEPDTPAARQPLPPQASADSIRSAAGAVPVTSEPEPGVETRFERRDLMPEGRMPDTRVADLRQQQASMAPRDSSAAVVTEARDAARAAPASTPELTTAQFAGGRQAEALMNTVNQPAPTPAFTPVATPAPAVSAPVMPAAPLPLTEVMPPQLETLSLARQADSAEWGNGLGERVQWMINQKQNSAMLRLDPPALGKLDVQVKIADDATTITIQTQHAQTRDLIESASHRLRDFLQESGYQNVNVDVSQRQDQQQARTQRDAADSAEQTALADTESDADDSTETLTHGYLKGDGLLDTFA